MIRKPLTGLKTFVWEDDKALDRKAELFADAWKRYRESDDPSVLPVRDGCKLTVFKVAPLTPEQFMTVYDLQGMRMLSLAVRYGIRSVENFYVGETPIVIDDRAFEETDAGPLLGMTALNKIWLPELIAALGHRVIEVSKVDPT